MREFVCFQMRKKVILKVTDSAKIGLTNRL
jgi:hypothetical protein